METDFRMVIASPPDRERLVAEIWVGNEHLAEINQESEACIVELYPRRSGEPWQLAHDNLLMALTAARLQLEDSNITKQDRN